VGVDLPFMLYPFSYDWENLEYLMRAIITRSLFETALDCKYIADFRPTFPCLVYKMFLILTTLDYKPH
jgi:hypothetical protein